MKSSKNLPPTLKMHLITLLALPHIIIWLLTRSRRAFRWLTVCAVVTVQLFSLLPFVIIAYAIAEMPVMIFPADYPLRISWYDPALGGTNCDHDCTTMASGDKVAAWLGGRGGVYAAACPRSNGWHIGLQFVLDGVIYECRDTGGWINCYQPGQLDRAIQNAHSRGYLLDVPAIAEQSYCWVDLLNGSQYAYGSLVHDWGFVK